MYPLAVITDDMDVDICACGPSISVPMNLVRRGPVYMPQASNEPPFLAFSRIEDTDKIVFDCAIVLSSDYRTYRMIYWCY